MSDFHENNLGKILSDKLSEHLKGCDKCRNLEEKIFRLKSSLPDLNEEVPFFLKNRLYYIAETEKKGQIKNYAALKWLAAMIGVTVLFLNLFYFTNIYPSANKMLHKTVSRIENFIVEAKVFIEQIGGSKVPEFNNTKKLSETEKKREKNEEIIKNTIFKGVKYG